MKRCLTEKRREEKKFKLSELALADSVRRFSQDKSGLAGGGSERTKGARWRASENELVFRGIGATQLHSDCLIV